MLKSFNKKISVYLSAAIITIILALAWYMLYSSRNKTLSQHVESQELTKSCPLTFT